MLMLIILINSFIKICHVIPFYLFVVMSRIWIMLIRRTCYQARARCCRTKSRYLRSKCVMHFVLYLWYDLGCFLCVVSRSWERIESFTNLTIFCAVEWSSSISLMIEL